MPTVSQRLALSTVGLWLQQRWKARRRRRRLHGAARSHGRCPVCDRDAVFADHLDNPRESPVCLACGSTPRQRALVAVLAELGLDLARLRIHESSPSLCTWRHFSRRCPGFVASYWWPDLAPGRRVGRFVCVDLQHQHLPDGCFDLVVTEDVLEHVPDPLRALREVQRTLRPGGHHVFTVPRDDRAVTRSRAEWRDGALCHLLPPEHHRDPIAEGGALVVTDWGRDLEQRLAAAGIACSARRFVAPDLGVPRPVEVFVAT